MVRRSKRSDPAAYLHGMRRLVFLIAVLIAAAGSCRSQQPAGRPAVLSATGDTLLAAQGFVTDLTGAFSPAEKTRLEDLLRTYERRSSNQVAVVTLPGNITAAELPQYAKDLHNHWGIGQKAKNNGMLIALSLPHRAVRISTGSGLEGTLTDTVLGGIIRTVMVPQLKEGRYFEAVQDGAQAIIERLTTH